MVLYGHVSVANKMTCACTMVLYVGDEHAGWFALFLSFLAMGAIIVKYNSPLLYFGRERVDGSNHVRALGLIQPFHLASAFPAIQQPYTYELYNSCTIAVQ